MRAVSAITRTTRTITRTSCTRTTCAPRDAMYATAAAVPSTRSVTSPPSTVPMNDFRDGPTSTGRPTPNSPSISFIKRRLCSDVFPNPSPGSMHSRSRSMPAASAAATRAAR